MKYKTKLRVLAILYGLLSVVFWICWILAPIFLILAGWQNALAIIIVAFVCKWVKQEIMFFVIFEMKDNG